VSSPPAGAPGGPAELRADAARNRAKVLRAARDLLAGGDTALPFNAIARSAEVGVGTVYRHFPSRRSLLEALATPSFQDLVGRVRAAALDPDPLSGVHQVLRHGLRCLLDDPALVAILDSPSFDGPQVLALGAEMGGAVVDLLGRAQEAGLVRADLVVDDLRRILVGLYHAVRSGQGSEEAAADRYVEIAVGGLGPS
jgi:AcrR family transcriptional regulator